MDANLATSAYLLSSKNNDFLTEYLHLLRAIRIVGRFSPVRGWHATSSAPQPPKRHRVMPFWHFGSRRMRNRRCIYSKARAGRRHGEFQSDPRTLLAARG